MLKGSVIAPAQCKAEYHMGNRKPHMQATFRKALFCLLNIFSGTYSLAYSIQIPQSEPGDSTEIYYDYLMNPYKKIGSGLSGDSIYVSFDVGWIEVDTTIIYDGKSLGSAVLDSNIILLADYYRRYISSPRHEGDPNGVKLSFLVDELGRIVTIHVLENVRNACSNDWVFNLNYDFRIMPFFTNSKIQTIEYIASFDDICYCKCELIEKKGSKRRRGKR